MVARNQALGRRRQILLLWIVGFAVGATSPAVAAPVPADAELDRLLTSYVHEFLKRNPVVATYLGGAAVAPELANVDGTLRDYSPRARSREAKFLARTRARLRAIDPSTLSAEHRIDRDVALRQIAFMLRQNDVRKYWHRSLDTYVNEPFRGIDWALQGMARRDGGGYGARLDWLLVIARVTAIPRYLETARKNLEAGIAAGDRPDDPSAIDLLQLRTPFLGLVFVHQPAVFRRGRQPPCVIVARFELDSSYCQVVGALNLFRRPAVLIHHRRMIVVVRRKAAARRQDLVDTFASRDVARLGESSGSPQCRSSG